jgi:anti-sigma regulatory factor (Ser/Thr protein kinase)
MRADPTVSFARKGGVEIARQQESVVQPCDAMSPAHARAWSQARLGDILAAHPHRGELIDDTVLAVSELVTNAIRAGCSAHTVSIAVDDDAVTVAVTDDVPSEPVLKDPSPTDAGGRGLQIVSALTTAWGVRPEGSGKSVWAQFPYF